MGDGDQGNGRASCDADIAHCGCGARRCQGAGAAARLDWAKELVQSLAVALAARAESRNLKSEVAFADDLPTAVIGDLLRLRTALENLIDNAVKFTESGTVRLDVSSEPAARGRVRLIFAVTDSGIGLSAAEDAASVSAVRPGEQDDPRIAMAAPALGSVMSNALPRRWAAISRSQVQAAAAVAFTSVLWCRRWRSRRCLVRRQIASRARSRCVRWQFSASRIIRTAAWCSIRS